MNNTRNRIFKNIIFTLLGGAVLFYINYYFLYDPFHISGNAIMRHIVSVPFILGYGYMIYSSKDVFNSYLEVIFYSIGWAVLLWFITNSPVIGFMLKEGEYEGLIRRSMKLRSVLDFAGTILIILTTSLILERRDRPNFRNDPNILDAPRKK